MPHGVDGRQQPNILVCHKAYVASVSHDRPLHIRQEPQPTRYVLILYDDKSNREKLVICVGRHCSENGTLVPLGKKSVIHREHRKKELEALYSLGESL